MVYFYKSIAKLVRKISQLAGKKGTDLPGKVLRKIDKNVLKKLAEDYEDIVFITGTNGKTTTSNLIGHVLKENNIDIVNNFEGANMLDGIISTFAIQTEKNTKIAIIEIDEGSIKKVMKYITPTKFVIINFFRDQIDRFGEIDTLIATIGEQLQNKNIKLILNADDPFVTRLSKYGKDNAYFGIDSNAYSFIDNGISESKFCPNCGNILTYNHTHYSQLGDYLCRNCGFSRPTVDYLINDVKLNPFILLKINDLPFISTKISGAFNMYNILAAYSLLDILGLDFNQIEKGLATYSSKNGRMQTIETKNSTILLNLAKNPAGLNASLSIANSVESDVIIDYLLVLNDNGADGFDISWIWDTDFEILKNQNIKNIVCSGKRAKELALRLKYTDIQADIIVIENIKEAAQKIKSYKEKYIIAIPNYTALVETQKELENNL